MSIEHAGALLLKTLSAKKHVRMSYFYNASDESEEMLIRAGVTEIDTSFEDGDDEVDPDEHEAAAWLIEIAASQLEEAGLITTEKLANLLIDDEPDYSMTLTEKGEAFVASGKKFPFSDPE